MERGQSGAVASGFHGHGAQGKDDVRVDEADDPGSGLDDTEPERLGHGPSDGRFGQRRVEVDLAAEAQRLVVQAEHKVGVGRRHHAARGVHEHFASLYPETLRRAILRCLMVYVGMDRHDLVAVVELLLLPGDQLAGAGSRWRLHIFCGWTSS